MSQDHRKQTIEWLRDWSKWLITLDFAAVTGCTAVLQGGVKGLPRPFLLLAIAAFALSVALSVAVVRALSTAIETEPDSSKSVLDIEMFWGLTIRTGTRLQLAGLLAGAVFFLAWVVLKPLPTP